MGHEDEVEPQGEGKHRRATCVTAQGLVPREVWESDAESVHRRAVALMRDGTAAQGGELAGDVSLRVIDPREIFDEGEIEPVWADMLLIEAHAEIRRAPWWRRASRAVGGLFGRGSSSIFDEGDVVEVGRVGEP